MDECLINIMDECLINRIGDVIMSSTIYYFSATGNSLEIALQIAKKVEDCTISSMAD